jgi:hypothetical protein
MTDTDAPCHSGAIHLQRNSLSAMRPALATVTCVTTYQ